MYRQGDFIIYGELGVFTVQKIAPLDIPDASEDDVFYHLMPYMGSGVHYAPVNGNAFMRPIMSAEEISAFVASIPSIAPAVCNDNRFNHVDTFYREMFKQHTNEALVAVIKGLSARMVDKKSKSSRAELLVKRARDILYSEISASLGIPVSEVPAYLTEQLGSENMI